MKHEYQAHFAFALQDSTTRAYTLDWLIGKSTEPPDQRKEMDLVEDDYARLEILAQALVTGHKEQARMGSRKSPSGLYYWAEYRGKDFLTDRINFINKIFTSSLPNLTLFPPGSWAIQIHFTLRKPYLSKDDTDFYIIDNPVKKEWVFKVPYVAPSQWKGALRAAMARRLAEEAETLDVDTWIERRLQLARLFGNEKGVGLDDERFEVYLDQQKPEAAQQYRQRLKGEYTPTGFLAGRLHFYPTFFDRIGLEVINPHDRKTGAGKNPIYFECVPAGTKGVFTLLYVPLVGVDEDTAKADLKAVAEGIKAMLTEYGFGSKTSSGHGVTDDEVEQGIVLVNFADIPESLEDEISAPPDHEPPEEAFLKYMDESGHVKPEFKGSGEGGLMSNSEYKQRGEALGGGSLAEFKRFRSWYVQHGANWRVSRATQTSVDSGSPARPQRTFRTLSEFVKIAYVLIREGGENA
ncbi:MAG: hypothetical protein J7L69_10550 [Desulfobulbaceae bacterium]|nr:hypothetical protein [Desulfobulbaceae bacterium]